MSEDYYDLLGVSKNSTREEIKKAYKKLAKKYHPDNQETGDAERFKKINEAAAVLGDDKKRQHYDQFGTAEGFGQGGGAGGFDFSSFQDAFGGGAGDFGDIFDHLGDLFGGSFGFGSRGGRRRRAKGNDLRYDIDISLEEAAFGTTKKVEFSRLGKCEACNGSGAESESDIITCPDCNGQGQVRRTQRTPFGLFQTTSACPKCRGEGTSIKNECRKCDGTGLVRETKNLEIKVPAGIDDGMRLRIGEEGDAAPKNGVNGDLYVFISVMPHKHFVREENDIHLEVPISVSQAALGTNIEVPTLLGKATLKIPAGTQPETVFRMRDKGIKDLHGNGIGDQMVKVVVKIPEKLNKKEKKLFEELGEESKKSGFFKRLFE
ncbi:molecular chaperone DnaJ [Candidatus Woesearchaeota archaeon]|nr:molecular chaperone DnaJ [Candidatus Woesearchaeota archaeon]